LDRDIVLEQVVHGEEQGDAVGTERVSVGLLPLLPEE
jgi:hypothetical protein